MGFALNALARRALGVARCTFSLVVTVVGGCYVQDDPAPLIEDGGRIADTSRRDAARPDAAHHDAAAAVDAGPPAPPVDEKCAVNGCLRSVTSEGSYRRAELEAYL